MGDFMMRDETWDAVCDSLKSHPTLQVLNFPYHDATMTPTVLKSSTGTRGYDENEYFNTDNMYA